MMGVCTAEHCTNPRELGAITQTRAGNVRPEPLGRALRHEGRVNQTDRLIGKWVVLFGPRVMV